MTPEEREERAKRFARLDAELKRASTGPTEWQQSVRELRAIAERESAREVTPGRRVPPVGIPSTPQVRDLDDDREAGNWLMPGCETDYRYTAYAPQGSLADMRTAIKPETLRTHRPPSYEPAPGLRAPVDDAEAEVIARRRGLGYERKIQRQVIRRLREMRGE